MEANDKKYTIGHLPHHNHARLDGTIVDHDYGIHVEEYFRELLCLERKRSERTGKPLLLMRLAFEKDFLDPVAAVGKIVDVLALVTRETDVIGWIARKAVIGVIFTDIAEEQLEGAVRNIDRKLRDAFARNLAPDVIDSLAISFQVFPERCDKTANGEPFNMLFYPDVVEESGVHRAGDALKRVMDVVGSLVGLILFSPLFVAIAVLIKATSPGPVLFRQERYGQNGRRFVFLKFRSMYVNNDDAIHRAYISKLIAGTLEAGAQAAGAVPQRVYKITRDPRVTPLGRLLRKSSLDELPQFINVLRGEMSLVGPRPPIPYELEKYDAWHRERLLGKKPGITGLWQVTGRSTTTFDSMVRLDLQYIRKWSLWLDIKLLVQTPLAVLRGRGAY